MSEQKEIDRTRYFELKKQLEEASRLYYKDGVSPMSDQDFDFGLKEMEALEAKYPELRGKGSLTQKVGSDLTNDFAKVAHAVPMLSIANVYSEEEMREFVNAAEEGIEALDERRETRDERSAQDDKNDEADSPIPHSPKGASGDRAHTSKRSDLKVPTARPHTP